MAFAHLEGGHSAQSVNVTDLVTLGEHVKIGGVVNTEVSPRQCRRQSAFRASRPNGQHPCGRPLLPRSQHGYGHFVVGGIARSTGPWSLFLWRLRMLPQPSSNTASVPP